MMIVAPNWKPASLKALPPAALERQLNEANAVLHILKIPTNQPPFPPHPAENYMRLIVHNNPRGAIAAQIDYKVGRAFDDYIAPGPRPEQDGQIAGAIAAFLREVERATQARREVQWIGATEILLERINDLLDDRGSLEKELAKALGDLDVAHTRIEQLEYLHEILKREAYRTKDHVSKAFVASIAVAFITAFGGIAQTLIERASPSAPAVQNSIQAAKQVVVNCGDATANPTINMPPAGPSDALPNTP
jgi:hypothetical protein